ncbi:AraC family transcriptional regulator [Oenococcus oeni]|uniref:helix-turn-helix domain-containing protein n=1 Tax=Oenococcus oeni TaxID=1247 RepID=UPI000BDF4DAC|nr:AraC family transcriptional regulator [Oenococcus oeni]PDH90452.1 AraC family transcriptional regulator [Oenococcus oeni]
MSKNVIRIDYSYNEIVEFGKSKNKKLYLFPGILKFDKRIMDQNNYSFRKGHYQGITILVKKDIKDPFLKQFFGEGKLFGSFNQSEDYFFLKSDFIKNFFDSLLIPDISDSLLFLRLKAIELLLYLSSERATKDIISKQKISIEKIGILRDIQIYLDNNLDRKISLTFLSNNLHISESKLEYLFKDTYGITIHDYFLIQKIDYACQMLKNTNNKITDIANEVGYENASKFSAVFKNRKLLTPREYRYLNKIIN